MKQEWSSEASRGSTKERSMIEARVTQECSESAAKEKQQWSKNEAVMKQEGSNSEARVKQEWNKSVVKQPRTKVECVLCVLRTEGVS